MNTLNIFVVSTTSIVCFVGLIVAVWTFYGTRKLKPVPNKPTPAPTKTEKTWAVVEPVYSLSLDAMSRTVFCDNCHNQTLSVRYLMDNHVTCFCTKCKFSTGMKGNVFEDRIKEIDKNG